MVRGMFASPVKVGVKVSTPEMNPKTSLALRD
jgi:hypothetical protein